MLNIFRSGIMVPIFPVIRFYCFVLNFFCRTLGQLLMLRTLTHTDTDNCYLYRFHLKAMTSCLCVVFKKKSTIQIIFCITENKSSLVSRGHIKRNSKIIRHIPEVRLLLNHWAQGYFGQLCNMAGNGLFGLPSEFTPAMQKTYALICRHAGKQLCKILNLLQILSLHCISHKTSCLASMKS